MLTDQIQSDLKQAQLERNELKVSTLRMLLSELHYAQIQKGRKEIGELADDEVVAVIQREVKKRKEAIEGFEKGGRKELVEKEEGEAKILSAYLPAQLSDEQLQNIVESSIKETGASSIADMGKVIGLVMSKVKGQADGGKVSALVRDKLKAKGCV